MSAEYDIGQEVRQYAQRLRKKYPDYGYEIAKALAEVGVEVGYDTGEADREAKIDPADD